MNDPELLRANLAKLGAKDREFAESLLRQLDRKAKLSDRQWPWIGKLAERALNPPVVQELDVGQFHGVVALFKAAKQHLKYPKITLALPLGPGAQLSLAGGSSKHPGSINVTDGAPFGQNVWYGRVSPGGMWTTSPILNGDEVLADQMFDLLAKLAEKPAATAAAYGKLTGHCCFCLRELTDERSILIGYGKVCAGHYGLPWGSWA